MDAAYARLRRWDPARGEVYAEAIANPRFPAAARRLASGTMGYQDARGTIAELFQDGGAYVAAMWTAYLHATDELTLPALKAIGAASGFLSTGRARDVLNQMVHLKFVEMVSPAAGKAPARYAPTAMFLDTWHAQYRWALAAACELDPAAGEVLSRMEDPATAARFSYFHARNLFNAAAGGSGSDSPFFNVFVHRRAGPRMLSILALAGAPDDPFPARGPIPLSIAGTAQRLGVSRIHIARMLEDGETQGFLTREARGAVTITEAAQPLFQFHFAMQLIHLLAAARDTAAELAAPQSA